MTFKIAICDDDSIDCENIKKKLEDIELTTNYDFTISVFNDSRSLLSTCTRAGIYNIIFLDVEMPHISGLQLAKKIRELPDDETKIIFTSNYPEYMQSSFNVNAYQYLSKPVSTQSILEQLKRILRETEKKKASSIVIKHNNHEEIIYSGNILYIETVKGEKNSLRYVCLDTDIIGVGKISDLEKALMVKGFLSPHRGILVNMNLVHFIKPQCIEMINGSIIPLSRRREKEFKSFYNKTFIE